VRRLWQKVRNFQQTDLVDVVISLDDARKKLQGELDNTLAAINNFSREIGGLMKGGKKDDAEKCARLVIHKINLNIMPPTVTKKELDSLQIKY